MKLFLLGFGAGALLVIILLVLTIWGFLYISKKNMAEKLKPVTLPDTPVMLAADYNFSFSKLDNDEKLKLSDLKGKVIFLSIWDTWCGFCVAEMPSIEKLYNATRDNKIEYVFLSTQDKENTKRFIDKKGFNMPFYHLESDLPELFNAQSLPRTYIISPDGKIVLQHIGAAQWFNGKTIDFIQGLKSIAH